MRLWPKKAESVLHELVHQDTDDDHDVIERRLDKVEKAQKEQERRINNLTAEMEVMTRSWRRPSTT